MFRNLNEQQKTAATAPNSPLLIVAGAGTGKTTTLTSRILHLIKTGIKPEKICAITFTNKAAKEMAERLAALTGGQRPTADANSNPSGTIDHRPPVISPFMGTFHALGARILRKEARALGRKANFAIFDGHDSFEIVKKIAKKLSPAPERSGQKSPLTKKEMYERPAFFMRQISAIKNVPSFLPELRKKNHPKNILALKAFEFYEKELEKNNAFDFDDLIEKTVCLLERYPLVLEKYRNKFDAILVDEYQDLNPKQYDLIKLLAGGHKNLSVVGDDEQMIYGWRHADSKIFFNFEINWPGAQISFLEENYRSTANIIKAASQVAKNNVCRRDKNLWTKNSDGELIKIFAAAGENEEAEWIAEKIFNFQFPISKQETTAVLYRTNAQSRAIEQALILRQIPYKIFGGLKFYERKEIKDIVSALRYAANDKDELSRERLEKLLPQKKFSELKSALFSQKNRSPSELIGAFIKTTGYLDYLGRNYLNHDERRENVAELISFAGHFNDLAVFLEEIALVQQADMPSAAVNDKRLMTNDDVDSSGTTDGQPSVLSHKPIVNLMTIHLAKGLEFDRVFIAGCSEGLLPHAMSLDNESELEEERRLMYVAMTRAKKELNICFYDLPSRFIGEIPGELLEFKTDGGAVIDYEN